MTTQTERVYEALRLGPLTSASAFTGLGCVHLPRRIKDLKELGVDIHTESVSGTNRYGLPVHYNVYTLHPGPTPVSFKKAHVKGKRTPYLAGLMKAARLVADAPDFTAAKAAIRDELSRVASLSR